MPKTYWFLTSIFLRFGLHFGRFWEPLGPLLAGLGHPKCGPRGCPSLRESSFVSTFVVFVARLSVFFDLGGFGKGFWRFGEGFLSGFREFCDHFNIDFYNFYRFRGATLLSLFFFSDFGWLEKVASRKRVSWKQNPCGCHSLGHSSLNHGPAACAKRLNNQE